MKRRNKLIKGLLSVLVLTGVLAQGVLAAEPEEPSEEHPYTYSVTLSAGKQGTFADGDRIVREELKYGDYVNFDWRDQLTLKDDKYYAKGIRRSGEDNSNSFILSAGKQGTFADGDRIVREELKYGDYVNFDWRDQLTLKDDKYYAKGIRRSGEDNSNSFITDQVQVTGDEDYVVAYGVLGDMVAYTVQYLDENGNELAPSKTYYGSVGDRPVVAFQYIEGYLPQAYNLTKTLSENEADNVFPLSENEADNVFPFEYAPASEIRNVTVTVDGGTTVVTTPAAGTGTAQQGAAAAGGAAADENAGGNAEGDTVEVEDEEVPRDLVDLDEEEVPLAKGELEEDTIRETSVMPIVVGSLIALLAVAGIVGMVIYYKKKKN